VERNLRKTHGLKIQNATQQVETKEMVGKEEIVLNPQYGGGNSKTNLKRRQKEAKSQGQ